MLRAMNATFITLIPKKENTNRLEQFRLITLCNVVYKIVTKLIVERLKRCLKNLISNEQGDFVMGRQILHEIVVATETINSMVTSKEKALFIKMDMVKAYDGVKWDFLQIILLAFGFCGEWVDWVMSFVSSTPFSILVNGVTSDLLQASRGLRQGDPLSPYLFIIMVEGLRRLIKDKVREGLI